MFAYHLQHHTINNTKAIKVINKPTHIKKYVIFYPFVFPFNKFLI